MTQTTQTRFCGQCASGGSLGFKFSFARPAFRELVAIEPAKFDQL